MSKITQIKWFRRRSCIGKVSHTNIKLALKVLLQQREKGKDVDDIYKCVFCNKYHLGHYKNRKGIKKMFRILKEIENGN